MGEVEQAFKELKNDLGLTPPRILPPVARLRTARGLPGPANLLFYR